MPGAGTGDGLCECYPCQCKLSSHHHRVTLCSSPGADSCSRKHMLRLKGRTAEILFIDVTGRCAALNACPLRAGIVSLPTMAAYTITFCVYNTLYIHIHISLPVWIQWVISIKLCCSPSYSKIFGDLSKAEGRSTTDSRKLKFNGGIHSALCLMLLQTVQEGHPLGLHQSFWYEASPQGLEICVWNIN